ncbi:MAG: ribokinase [Candidatus Bathyarchaeia archaeon]
MKSIKPRIIVVGSIHMDFTILVDRLPKTGETIIGRGFKMSPGGKGANQAVAVAKLGAEAYMVGRVGDDYLGNLLMENMSKNGVNIDFVKKDPSTYSGLAFITVDQKGKNTISVAPGADLTISNGDVEEAINVIKQADIMLLQLEIPLEVVMYAAKKAFENNIKVILNPAPYKPLPKELLENISILTPNEIEVSMMSKVKVKGLKDLIKAGKKLLNIGIEKIIITLGDKGAMLVSKEKVIRFPAIKVKAIDTTGAGDAFNGALAVALAEGKIIDEAIKFANFAGALTTTKVGAQEALPTKEEIEELMKKFA